MQEALPVFKVAEEGSVSEYLLEAVGQLLVFAQHQNYPAEALLIFYRMDILRLLCFRLLLLVKEVLVDEGDRLVILVEVLGD